MAPKKEEKRRDGSKKTGKEEDAFRLRLDV